MLRLSSSHLGLLALLAFRAASTVTTVIITTSASIPRDSSSYTDGARFREAMLDEHNHYRGQHNAKGVQWNTSLALNCAKWAKSCVWGHSVGLYPQPITEHTQHLVLAD